MLKPRSVKYLTENKLRSRKLAHRHNVYSYGAQTSHYSLFTRFRSDVYHLAIPSRTLNGLTV